MCFSLEEMEAGRRGVRRVNMVRHEVFELLIHTCLGAFGL